MRRLWPLLACAAGPALATPLPSLTLSAPGYTVRAEVHRAVAPPASGPQAAYFDFSPAQVRAVLRRPGERGSPGSAPVAYVTVTPVQNWLGLYKGANARAVRRQLDLIREIGTEQRALNARTPLPQLPLTAAAPALRGAVQRVSTARLWGVRYLAVDSQDASAFPRSAVFYAFQGLTRDGRFVVSARLPYAPASFPARVGAGDQPKDWPRYVAQAQARLDAESGKLTRLDAIVQSVRVR